MQLTKYTAVFATVMAGLVATQASAQSTYFGDESDIELPKWDRQGIYGSVSGLIVFPDEADLAGATDSTVEFDPSAGISFAFGYEFAGNWRTEVQYSYMGLEFDPTDTTPAGFDTSGNSSIQSLMVNGYYDFPFTVKIQPYAGVGVGLAHHILDIGENESDTTFALQLMAGVGYKLDPSTTISAGVRAFGTDEPDFDAGYEEFATIVIEFGIRFGF